EFHLSAEKEEYVSEVIHAENNSICIGKVNNLELELFAINILPKLKLHDENEMEVFSLSAGEKEYVSEVIRVKNNSIWLGKVKNLRLKSFAIRILPKLKLHEENEMEVFHLSAGEIEHILEVMFTDNNSIWLGRVKRLKLESFTTNILPKLRFYEESDMEGLPVNVEETECGVVRAPFITLPPCWLCSHERIEVDDVFQ
ncbi:MAG: uncharacterized protein A8A55_2647, partial [Amphiamblys sp. WSBS2006]